MLNPLHRRVVCVFISLVVIWSCAVNPNPERQPDHPHQRIDDSTYQAQWSLFIDYLKEHEIRYYALQDSIQTTKEAHKWIGQIEAAEVTLSDELSHYSPALFLDIEKWQYVAVYGVLDTGYRSISIGAVPKFPTADTLLAGVSIHLNPDSTITIESDPHLPIPGYRIPKQQ